MGFGAIIVGDEIMRGKRQDKHMAKTIEILAVRGLELAWCRYVGDDPEVITRTLRETFAGGDVVLSFGGIGATPDDVTRQCAAAALGVPLARHPEAMAIILEKFGDQAYPKRVLMTEFPAGAAIVPNPYNRIPGFSVREHYFFPGFPEMAWPMAEWVLETHYAHLFHPAPKVDRSILVLDAPESQLIDLMDAVNAAYAGVKVYSLPSFRPEGRRIELGVRGPAAAAELALAQLKAGVAALGFAWQDVA
ncbi:MAG TPA: molybdopterin-binding protein [Pelomicrobium sp.]|nr:molybdopterin-binding protein [Pelomicrobium sp.]